MFTIITVQPKEVGKKIEKGEIVYPNDKEIVKYHTDDFDDGLLKAYHWMIQKMIQNDIKGDGNSLFPFWGWKKYAGKDISDLNKKDKKELDYESEKDCLITLLVNPKDILLSEFDSWNIVINDQYLNTGSSDAEYDKNDQWFDNLDPEDQYIEKIKSWDKIFNIELFNNDYIGYGDYIQGTFWKLDPTNVISIEYV